MQTMLQIFKWLWLCNFEDECCQLGTIVELNRDIIGSFLHSSCWESFLERIFQWRIIFVHESCWVTMRRIDIASNTFSVFSWSISLLVSFDRRIAIGHIQGGSVYSFHLEENCKNSQNMGVYFRKGKAFFLAKNFTNS